MCITYTISSNSTTTSNTSCNNVASQRESILTNQVSSSFTEVVDVVVPPPEKKNSGDEVDVALTALAMLPVKVRRLSLACKSWDVHPRFSEICPRNLRSNHIGDAGASHLATLSNLTSLNLGVNLFSIAFILFHFAVLIRLAKIL